MFWQLQYYLSPLRSRESSNAPLNDRVVYFGPKGLQITGLLLRPDRIAPSVRATPIAEVRLAGALKHILSHPRRPSQSGRRRTAQRGPGTAFPRRRLKATHRSPRAVLAWMRGGAELGPKRHTEEVRCLGGDRGWPGKESESRFRSDSGGYPGLVGSRFSFLL